MPQSNPWLVRTILTLPILACLLGASSGTKSEKPWSFEPRNTANPPNWPGLALFEMESTRLSPSRWPTMG